ncbi:hypothetical protein V2J09_007019 [Rumex salicifolius]
MKRQKQNPFDNLSEEIIFSILDRIDSFSKKSFSLTCKSYHSVESRHRKTLRPLRSGHLPRILARYGNGNLSKLDLTLCPRVSDAVMSAVSAASCAPELRSVDLSRSRGFSASGLARLVAGCVNLVEIDLSNATWLRDSAMAVMAEAKNLERLWLGRCKLVTDIGIGCVAVGCQRLKLVSLKWCLGVGDLGVELIAIKCKEIRSLDLSYLQITSECLPAILKLQYLEELVLEGCFGIDDENLAKLKQGPKSLKTLDMSSCQNVSHVGLSSFTSGTEGLQQLVLAYGSPVTGDLASSLKRLSRLQSIKLDGCFVTCSGLKAIGDWCMSLKELSLSKCTGVTDEGLSSIVVKQKELMKVDITCCRKITDLSIAYIANSCTHLRSLKMESCAMVSMESFVLIGQRCRLLEELDVTDNVVDDEGLKSISRCKNLSSLKLGICNNVTDEGLIQVGICCSKIVDLDLYRCIGINDSALLAISQGCPGLETINMSYCKDITDNSLLALSKCSNLNTLECRGCPLITSMGLVAIAAGCRQLTKLDIKKCSNIDDFGMIPLARFSQNLRHINLSYSSITDVGLLSLASISCLQTMIILHLRGLTPRGLAAALVACGTLTKVKLHASFKSRLPQMLFEHLEARGCIFIWREKEYEEELDAESWQLLLEELEH